MVELKVCGITSAADARAAIDAGARYLGFNFYAPSPRFIEPATARRIIDELPDEVIPVGVFVNEPAPENVVELMRASGVRIAQLHGDEDARYCERVGDHRVIKALRCGEGFNTATVLEYPASAILLDAWDAKLYGGTGRRVNWETAREAAKLVRLFLAGGLAPENIAEAIEAVAPFAVDVNSGVESAPGRKDPKRLQRLKLEMEQCR
ncbi:MAG: phosphoribosylanthranilate isomerase [Acidobacteria bacterium]|nr:phosphoribosylanthranilate isomerase [Acidobacteriota bacterium]MCW5970842.1 phosphoribosylanthranilate isomerase [Blastocatellales bacterium]